MWSDGVRRRRVLRDSTLGTALERTRRVAGARPSPSRDVTLGRGASSVPRQRLLAAREPRITLLYLAGSPEQAYRQPPDRAGSGPPIPRLTASQSQQPGGEPEWYRVAVELSRPPVVTETPATIMGRVPKPIVVACIVAAAGLICGGISAYLLTRHGGSAPIGGALPSSAHIRTISTPVQQAETWITANVAADTPLCADRAVAAQLREAGFTAASSCRPNGTSEENRFVVSTPDIRAAVAGSLAAAGQGASLPVAVFGGSAERVEVRIVVPGAQAALSARLARDLDERALAAAALLHNPRITATASARAALRQGQLDIRAATLLALLAARTPFQVDTIMIRPPEQAAGRPVRSITVSVTDPAALTATTRMLTDDYIPTLVTAAAGGTRLDWPVGLAPNAGPG
jgi:hypothetical protein